MELVIQSAKSKTAWAALATTIFGALQAFDFTTIANPQTAGYITMAIGVIMYVLRLVTKEPLSAK